MHYIVIKKFGPGSDRWEEYAKWAGLENVTEYYSIDGMLQKNVFIPESLEDWENCINEDFKLDIIKNLSYARKIKSKYPDTEIIGIIENPISVNEKTPSNHILLGYDILDGHCSISLLTNWGGKGDGLKKIKFNKYALIDKINYAYQVRDMLHKNHSDDSHAKDCEVWAIFKIKD